MGARFVGNVCVSTGEYKDKNTGKDKKVWKSIGDVFQYEEGGQSIHFYHPDNWARIFYNDSKPVQNTTQQPVQQPVQNTTQQPIQQPQQFPNRPGDTMFGS